MSPILIVEDDPDVRASIAEALEDEGYAVASAVDGLDALHYLHEQTVRPRLILLDMMMPRMDGYAFRAAQVSEARLADIPVAVVSADAQAGNKASTLQANGFLRKPIQLSDLLDLVARLAGQP